MSAILLLQIITVLMAALVAFLPNVLYAAISLLFCLLGVAGLYLCLAADFIAASQVVVYVGGITVVLIFAVMLTFATYTIDRKDFLKRLALPFVIAFGLIAPPLYYLNEKLVQHSSLPIKSEAFWELSKTEALGTALLSHYVLPFELASVLLLASLLGAVWMARYR